MTVFSSTVHCIPNLQAVGNTTALPLLDLVVIIFYMLLSIAIGCRFYFKSRSADSFTNGGQSIPSLIIGLSIFGTYVSSISFLANPGSSFVGNWNAWVAALTVLPCTWIAARWFIPFYRSCGSVSAYEHLESRFGVWARVYGTVCYMLTQLARVGSVLFLLAIPLHHLFGWNIIAIIVLVGLATTVYSMLGGIAGVIWTDAVQSAVLIIGATVCAIVLPLSMPEGPGQLFQIAWDNNKFSLGGMNLDFTSRTFWVVFFYGTVINLQNFGIDQNYVQRYMTAKSESAAKRSLWFGSLLYMPVCAFFFFIGTALYAFYQARPDLITDPNLLEQIASGNGDGVFPYFIVHQLPPGLTGLLIAAIVAAAMSTVSTSLNGAATLTLTDFYTRFYRPKASDREQMRVLRIASFLWGLFGIGCALAMIHAKGILDAYWVLAGIFSGGIVGVFLLGIFTRVANSRGALAGMVAGVLVILWMTASSFNMIPSALSDWKCPLHNYMIIVVGTITVVLVGMIVSLLMPGPRTRKNRPQ
ncbi:MAG: sodium:solute symporter [Planctomycetia bacterium]|nr:sodium:solute symporter [Planctomycetia bacterium]